MSSGGRLFVTPDELRREPNPAFSHPHGGEGRCGGAEGHGTNEAPSYRRGREEIRAREPQSSAAAGQSERFSAGGAYGSSTVKPRQNDKQKNKNTYSNVGHVTDNSRLVALREGMRMSVILGEPLCRRNIPMRRVGNDFMKK